MIKVAVPITGKEEYLSIKKIIFDGNFVSGANVELFEKKFSKYIGMKYAVCFNSGTAALHASFNAIGLTNKDEVIVPAISFVSSATSILHQGSIPIFCDVKNDNYCMDPKSLELKITPKTKAIVPVHFAGSACDMHSIKKIAKRYKLKIIEDCSQAHGSRFYKKKVGSFGDISCFSFYATKHMTTGEGGVLCTNSRKIYEHCKSFRTHGMTDRDTHQFLGFNYRMSEINAAIGLEQLKKLEKINKKRVKNSLYLLSKLRKFSNKNSWFQIQEPKKNIYHTYFWCPIKILKENISIESVKKKLLKKGIEIRSRYKFPLYKQKIFQNLNKLGSQNYKRLYLKNSEKIAGRIFGLPNHYKLSKKDLDYIVYTIINLF